MSNPWITHVKATQRKHQCSYKEAMKRAKKTYKKKPKSRARGSGKKPKSKAKGGAPSISAAWKGLKRGLKWFGKSPQYKILSQAANYGQYAAREYFRTNPRSTPGFLGERHAIELQGPYKGSTYSFLGPYTQVQKRVQRGDMGISPADNCARTHDLEYARIKQMPRNRWKAAIIASDRKFLRCITPYLNLLEIKIAYAAITAKMKLQAAGKLPYSAFIQRT